MTPYGTDRVRPGAAGEWIVSCRHSKGWTPRATKTLTSAEHPGTAVLWDGQYFEVVSAQPAAAGTVRYVLEPWRDNHAIRLTDSYDAASEARREAEWCQAIAREKGRVAANVLGVFTGHLPAIVQEHLSSEIGINATRLTVWSFALPVVVEAFVAMRIVGHVMNPSRPSVPLLIAALALYLLIETISRIMLVWSLNRPVGSALGFLAYLAYWLPIGRARGAISPFAKPKGSAIVITEAPVDVALRDAYILREPLLTLLTPEEQNAFEARFGFDYRKHAVVVIAIILFFSSAGIVTSIVSLNARGMNLSALTSLICAAAVGAEQVYRLLALRNGPVGSFLGALVRPFVAKLLV